MTYAVTEVAADNLISALPTGEFAYLGWLSFDPRCLSAATTLRRSGHKAFEFLSFVESRSKHRKNFEALKAALRRPKFEPVEVTRDDQLGSYRTLVQCLKRLSAKHGRVVIDLSAFPREYVCLAARCVNQLQLDDVVFIYNRSLDYSVGQPSRRKWLSVGTGSVEPILTFSGTFLPGRPVAMIALIGFDGDRVANIVEAVEPERLIIGLPETEDVRRDWITARIAQTARQLELRVSDVESFTFDCDNVSSTKAVIESKVSALDNAFDVCLAPNNNKLSTLAAALAAIDNKSLQLIFAPGLVYNVDGYATPSAEFQVIASG